MDLKGAERFKRAMPPCEAYWVCSSKNRAVKANMKVSFLNILLIFSGKQSYVIELDIRKGANL